MRRKSPLARAIAKQLSTPAGREAALRSLEQSDPAAARRIRERHALRVGDRVRYLLAAEPQRGSINRMDGTDAAYVHWDNGSEQLCLLEDLERSKL